MRDMEQETQRAVSQGDRITNLMMGHGGPLPDHITSATTYQSDQAKCDAAQGTPNQKEACGFIERATSALRSKKGDQASKRRGSWE
jgi:hypothetical protein